MHIVPNFQISISLIENDFELSEWNKPKHKNDAWTLSYN